MGNLRAIVERRYRDVAAQDWDSMREYFSRDVRTVMPGAPPMTGMDEFIGFGKVKRHTVYFDQMALMTQLGLVPEPTRA